MADECRVEMIDGEPIRVHGSRRMDDDDKAAFAEIAAAARAKFLAGSKSPRDSEPGRSRTGTGRDPATPHHTPTVGTTPEAGADHA